MKDKRFDAPRERNWLKYFEAKRGMGACICEGQEIEAAVREISRLRAENEALIEDRDKWMMRARMLWFGYRLTERMQMPEEGRWFSGEGE